MFMEVTWYCPVWVSSPGCVSCQLLHRFQPICWGEIVGRGRGTLGTVHTLLSSRKNTGVSSVLGLSQIQTTLPYRLLWRILTSRQIRYVVLDQNALPLLSHSSFLAQLMQHLAVISEVCIFLWSWIPAFKIWDQRFKSWACLFVSFVSFVSLLLCMYSNYFGSMFSHLINRKCVFIKWT